MSERFYCAIALVSLLLISSCARSPYLEYLKGDTMGTYYTVQCWSMDRIDTESLKDDIDSLLDDFESQLSNWRPDSWINRFNRLPADHTIETPDHAFATLEICLDLAERSQGILDPTLSPLIELWGFGTQDDRGEIPSAESIEEALRNTGYQELDFNREERLLSKKTADIQLNCSAVAKGYAVDLIASLLEKAGVENYLVNIGGEVAAKGSKQDASPWTVAISQPQRDGRDTRTAKTIDLRDRSLATSGHSQRAYVIDGQRYSHILDPRTGRPVLPKFASATVIAPRCAHADGLATLALILSKSEMQSLLKAFPQTEVIYLPWRIHDTNAARP